MIRCLPRRHHLDEAGAGPGHSLPHQQYQLQWNLDTTATQRNPYTTHQQMRQYETASTCIVQHIFLHKRVSHEQVTNATSGTSSEEN